MLHIAACHDSVDIVELVLAKGYPVDQQDQVTSDVQLTPWIMHAMTERRDSTTCSVQVG